MDTKIPYQHAIFFTGRTGQIDYRDLCTQCANLLFYYIFILFLGGSYYVQIPNYSHSRY